MDQVKISRPLGGLAVVVAIVVILAILLGEALFLRSHPIESGIHKHP